ncbi:hypothetical protein PCNPT3_12765 [Psychromonas sp. CNPT3]|uniref:hypothetical protein n=1 Tax=Psychromonas sp. CNPT3 TaxID=314282 RepID=UPI00006E505C|nr:hypothetical protein [Psychromonas sp. CNPT3]AGH82489.1 hypothetical protein PCNPT3_12765 [Psychromonas sp. CNPT3]
MQRDKAHQHIPTSDTEKLIEILGLTTNIYEAGYILADGRMLHLNRSNCFKRQNHLDVLKLLPDFVGKEHAIIDTDMMAFMAKEHLVRFCIDGKIHTATRPSTMQLRKIYNTLTYRSYPFDIILSNPVGMTLAQHTLSGPSMATLVNIFKVYDNISESCFSTDEFALKETKTHQQLIFLPSMKCVASLNKNSHIFKIEDEFKNVETLFMRLIAEHKP